MQTKWGKGRQIIPYLWPERDEVVDKYHPIVAQQENPVSIEIFSVRKNSGDESELTGEVSTESFYKGNDMKPAGVAGHRPCSQCRVVLGSTGPETGAKVFQRLHIRVVRLVLHTFGRVVK